MFGARTPVAHSKYLELEDARTNSASFGGDTGKCTAELEAFKATAAR